MAVDAAAQNLHRIVQVHAFQVSESDDAFQLGERGVARLARPEVVPRREGVAGVDADAHPRFVLHALDQIGEVLEAESEVRTLPRGVLDHRRHAVRAVERHVDRLGDPVERLLLGDLLQVAAGMEVQPVEAQQFAPLHLVEERRARFFERFLLGMSEVDQVRVVGQNLCGRVAVAFARLAEGVDLARGERFGDPLPLVLGEKGEARGSDSVCVGRSVLHAARSAYVRSEIFHSCSFPFNFQTKLKFL